MLICIWSWVIHNENEYNGKGQIFIYMYMYLYVSFARFAASDVSEDPFSSRQEESSEGFTHNSVVESLLQRNRDQSFISRDNQEGVFSRPARSFITEEILEALRKADRKGRDVVVGLSNACCKWGCSKSEISSLCWESVFFIWVNTCAEIINRTQLRTNILFLCFQFSWLFYSKCLSVKQCAVQCFIF